ncbi:YrrS family protein [Lentibacillus salinarum]|uniref:DUF1510 family protein n=1 Tax=Lentibacillus salinarum TaxID=446820 RepID=A0ABW3ZY80_9BACI
MPSSRVDKYEKRRKNTKRLSLLIVFAGILVVVLLGQLMFGGDDEAKEDEQGDSEAEQATDETLQDDEQGASTDSGQDREENSSDEETSSAGDSGTEGENTNEVRDTEQVEPSDDNVMEAYTASWDPVGTEQSEPHTIDYSDGSQDRQEMRKAVAAATGLNEDDFTMWWIERNGDQNVINTVSDPDESEVYRVYNTWAADEGWQPIKVERLKENDQKWRFE